MAALFCLFSAAICGSSYNDRSSNGLGLVENRSNDLAVPLSAQIISVPRVYLSPCPVQFRYAFNGKEWFGLVVISNPARRGIPSKLKVILTLGFHYSSRYVGEISLAKDKQSAVNDISNGLPILYRIKFPLQNPIPKLTAIYYNDHQICSGPKDYGQFVTTITLDHTLYTGLNNAAPQRPFFTTTTTTRRPEPVEPPSWMRPQTTRRPEPVEPPSWMRPQTTRRTLVSTVQPPILFDYECGNPDYRIPEGTGLIVGGTNAARGQFPWLAAYYHVGPQSNEFICGGSLISTRIVVTAAHCVHAKKDATSRKAEDAFFFLGKHDLEKLNGEQNFIWSAVSQLIVHSDWNYKDDRYDADIAIAVLSKAVLFNKFVKPICLWTTSTSYADIVGQTGVVAGWGKTEVTAISTDKPKWTKIPVVSEIDCIRSNNAFASLTSNRTFCAGVRNGTNGPCNGDSGGGFVMEHEGKWYLRGVISSALLNPQSHSCDTKNYAVFTDTTIFTSWLQSFIQIHG